ncbi:Apoptosis-inducing factor 2 [Seminavis robusta]|uniref:Apoptosis-inducing factor 2 n=1 Tax=Seminavis robusta TaxID=568900 RepID=A0A9N8HBS8_9STRA|nr:Apoptosis-inducing factor 2 [Seminavis robusta]|eukprot:Sro194_g082830.1 Apoptosis-inducing factor 2 (504) ;mRNA; r:44392-45903
MDSDDGKTTKSSCNRFSNVKDAAKQRVNAVHASLFGSKEGNGDLATVVVVGGGYGGVRVAKDLDTASSSSKDFQVVLIDRKNYFLNNIAGVPAAVQKGYADSMCIPYDKLFSERGNSTFLQAEVSEIRKDSVLVQGHEEPLYFDYCVIATGSSYSFPFKIADTLQQDAVERFGKIPDLIAQADHIVVAGGGAVGCEMAGEIKTCFPGENKRVTLVHSREALLPGDVKDELRDKTLKALQQLGVHVILGERLVDGLDTNNSPEDTTSTTDENVQNQSFLSGKRRKLQTNQGTELEADLVFLCWGAAVNSASLRAHFGSELIDKGPNRDRISVDPKTLLIGNTDNIFAIGDVAALESKMACYAGEQGSYVAKKLIATIVANKKFQNAGDVEPYRYWGHPYPAMMVPLGGKLGYMQTPCAKGNILGSPFAAMGKNHLIKSWALTVRPACSFKCPFTFISNNQTNQQSDKEDLAKALGLSHEDALLAIERGAFPITHDAATDGRTST